MKTFMKTMIAAGVALTLVTAGSNQAQAGGWPIAAGVFGGLAVGTAVGVAVATSHPVYVSPAYPVYVPAPQPVVVTVAVPVQPVVAAAPVCLPAVSPIYCPGPVAIGPRWGYGYPYARVGWGYYPHRYFYRR
jgi:hypothetical protein